MEDRLKIYFSGSITGGRDDAPLYAKLVEHLQKHHIVLCEHVGDVTLSAQGNVEREDRVVHDDDVAMLRSADVVVAEITQPSLGVGYELQFAATLGIPVLCLYRSLDGRRVSRMITGNSHFVCKEYSKLMDGYKVIDDFLDSLFRDSVRVLVGSTNPVKITAVKRAFSQAFSCLVLAKGVSVDSGVSSQPIGEEVFVGAQNRANALVRLDSDSCEFDYYVGLEGGVEFDKEDCYLFAVSCVIDSSGKLGVGESSKVFLPNGFSSSLLDGKELGEVIDLHLNKTDVKQAGGTMGYLTNGVVSREQMLLSATACALAPFIHKDLY